MNELERWLLFEKLVRENVEAGMTHKEACRVARLVVDPASLVEVEKMKPGRKPVAKVVTPCLRCGVEILHKPFTRRRYCSRVCVGAARRTNVGLCKDVECETGKDALVGGMCWTCYMRNYFRQRRQRKYDIN